MTTSSRAVSQRWVDLGEQQRARVAEAAVELVAAGATPLKVADLAARAGISRPTFYKYFPTLGAAVLHTVRTLIADLEAHLAASEVPRENARERLLAMFEASFDFARQRPEVTRFFSYFDFTFRATGLVGSEQREHSAIADVAGDAFHALFVAGQADGSIDPGLPTDVTYLALLTSVAGTSQRLLVETDWTTGSDDRARGVHETLIEVWRQALRPAEET